VAANLLDGKVIAQKIKDEVSREIGILKEKGITPSLTAVQVGENASSQVYINAQKKNCETLGINYNLQVLPATTTEKELISFIEKLNNEKNVNGIILQMPLPQGVNARNVQSKISPKKDVEGMNPANMGMLVYGNLKVGPCTALAVIEILKSTGSLKGKEAVIVGHSEIVGKPVSLLLLQWPLDSATTTVCHIATKDLPFHVKRAEVLVVAAGKPGLVKGDWIKEGAIVVDVGINRLPDGKIVGDVEFEGASARASWITPVPGGVGPVTTAILLKNTVEATKWQME